MEVGRKRVSRAASTPYASASTSLASAPPRPLPAAASQARLPWCGSRCALSPHLLLPLISCCPSSIAAPHLLLPLIHPRVCAFADRRSYGDEVQPLLEKLIRVRHDELLGYLHDLARNVTARGVPTMRPLWWDFGHDDPQLHGVDDQYLLGDRLLVAPVTVQNATGRRVVFPRGATWVSFWDARQSYKGGQAIDIDAPLGTPPVYWRS